MVNKAFFSITSVCLLMVTLLSGLLSSCSEDNLATQEGTPSGYMTLYIQVGDAATRAEVDGEDYYNENAIKTVDLFFFNPAATESTPSIKVGHFNFTNTKGTATCSVKISLDDIPALFDANNKCRVYAAVNCAATTRLGSATIATLNNITIGTAAATGGFNTNTRQADFVMYGNSDDVTYEKSSNSATGTIKVKRVAAKIRVAVHIEDALYQDKASGTILQPDANETQAAFQARMDAAIAGGAAINKWTPELTNMQAYIVNGVNNARLDGQFKDSEGNDLLNPIHYFTAPTGSTGLMLRDPARTYPDIAEKPTGLPASPTYDDMTFTHYNWLPFYTYPNAWKNAADEEYGTYLTVVVPWMNVNDNNSTYQATYYQVPVTRDVTEIQSNHYYRIRLNIGVIGSFTSTEPLEIEASYDIEPWGEENIDIDINDIRYLVVNQTTWNMDGEESITIPFYSSHDVKVVDVKVTYFNFNDTWNEQGWYSGKVHERTFDESVNERTKTYNGGEGVYSYSIDQQNKTLTFNHPFIGWNEYSNNGRILNTNANASPTYFIKNENERVITPYEIEITIRHTDQNEGTQFEEKIIIHQKPSIYIEAEHNNGGANSSGRGGNIYTFVNGNNYGTNTATTNVVANEWDNVYTLTDSTGTNNNPNMYVIHITQLSPEEGKIYTLGDPRALERNINLTDDSFKKNAQGAYLVNPETRWGNSSFTNNTFARRSTFIWATSRTGTGSLLFPYSYTYITSMYQKPNNVGTNTTSLNGYTNNQNNLYYYYPADETKDKVGTKEDFIAPTFRVASSFGKTAWMSKESARLRCASYQEYGYPAGRWRVPTKAEIKYIVNLSAEGKIPVLFGNTADPTNEATYWSSTGAVGVVAATNVVRDIPDTDIELKGVRCVYDDWYWVKEDGTPDKCDMRVFTWGDKPKSNPQVEARLRKVIKK